MKVVAYCRVSTEEQAANGISLAAQEAKLRSYCELWEREVIGERTSAALQHKKATGVKLGAPALSNEATLSRITDLRGQGLSLASIAQTLIAEGHQTQRGGTWQAMTVKKILDRVGA